jgi:hypothetical protein
MEMIVRIVGIAAVLAGATLGLASPASAVAPSGTYTATVTEASGTVGPAPIDVGATVTWALTPCGPDCARLEVNPPNPHPQMELRLQGNSWAGGPDELGCTKTISADASTATEVCKMWTIHYSLGRNG